MRINHNLYALFEDAFARHGEKTAVSLPDGRQFSFALLAHHVARYANALKELGVGPGDRITAQLDKSLENILLYLATLKIGAVFQPLNPAYTLREFAALTADAEPSLMVVSPARHRQALRIASASGATVTTVTTLAPGGGALSRLAANQPPHHRTVPRQPDDPAALLYTSGTSGRAKGALLSHENLSSNARALRRAWAFEADDVLLHALPLFHVHGLFVALNVAWLSGAGVILHERFNARCVIAGFAQATVMMGVPTFYTRLLSEAALGRETTAAMRLFTCGSAPLAPSVHHAFKERTGHDIIERYGLTETGIIASNPYDGERLAGSVGYALDGVSLRVADPLGRPLPPGRPGVIEVAGANVLKGYWRQTEEAARSFRKDGFFVTGDVGVLSADGRVAIVGREKDIIISGGLNVYPGEIETVIDRLPGIDESAVIGLPHPDFGEAVAAVVAADRSVFDETAIIAALAADLARFKTPKRVLRVDSLPRNAMGKVQKQLLRQQFAGLFEDTHDARAPR